MLFHVRMDVKIPHGLAQSELAEILSREKVYSQKLQKSGQWRHIWRLAGQYANFSIFDVKDNSELHEILSGLPLFQFMEIEVTPILRHPSAIREDDT